MLRKDKQKKDYDKKNICFICGKERWEIDKSIGFDKHIEDEHNLWNYLYYIYNFRLLDETDYNSIETYVDEVFKKKAY